MEGESANKRSARRVDMRGKSLKEGSARKKGVTEADPGNMKKAARVKERSVKRTNVNKRKMKDLKRANLVRVCLGVQDLTDPVQVVNLKEFTLDLNQEANLEVSWR